MNEENKSAGAVCFAALDEGEKVEPSVSTAPLIARLMAAHERSNNSWERLRGYQCGFRAGLRRAIQEIQASIRH